MMQNINTNKSRPKQDLITDIKQEIAKLKYEIVDEKTDKPWGGYFRFSDNDTKDFTKTFFKGFTLPSWVSNLNLAPKFLLIAPNKRLSWQFHDRRGELWHIIKGPVKIYLSETNKQPEKPKTYNTDDFIEMTKSTRHRLEGADNWGIIAEIWVHTDQNSPSTEEDIIRLDDDFGRN